MTFGADLFGFENTIRGEPASIPKSGKIKSTGRWRLVMTYKQIVEEAMRLPLQERLSLLDTLIHSIQQEFGEKRKSQTGSSLNRVFGVLKTDGLAPTDEVLSKEYVDYLVEKYL